MILTQNQEELAAWFARHTGLSKPRDMSYVGCSIEDKIVFVNGYENFNGVSMWMHTASDGKSILTRDFVWATFDYPFNFCRAQILIGPIASSNTRALRLTKHLGFKIEHVIQGAHPDGDLVIKTMRRSECRFLNQKWGRHGRI